MIPIRQDERIGVGSRASREKDRSSVNIEFPGPPVPTEDGGVSCRAKVDGELMVCHFTWEALQDVAPEFTDAQAIDQFKASRCRLLEIAEKKIRAGHVRNGVVHITKWDV